MRSNSQVLGLPVIDDRPRNDEAPFLLDGQDFVALYSEPDIRPTSPDVWQVEMEDLDMYCLYMFDPDGGANKYKLIEFSDPDVLERFLHRHIPKDTPKKDFIIRIGLSLMANYRIANLYLKEGRAEKVIPKYPRMIG
jgi:hypothetical protein